MKTELEKRTNLDSRKRSWRL